MQENAPEGTEDQEQGGAGLNVEVLRSYLTFAKQAILKRKLLIAAIAVLGMSLTIAAAKNLPRTYICKTVMMTTYNGVLDSDRGPQPLAGADLVMSHDNVEKLIQTMELKKKYFERRGGLLGFKDRMLAGVFGPIDDKSLGSMLIGTVQSRLSVEAEKETLTITAEWTDGRTAAELAQAALDSFLHIRSTTEISAFQEKMTILDSHAKSLRDEIETLAKQMKESRAARQAEQDAEARAKGAAAKGSGEVKRTAPRVSFAPSKPLTDEQLPEIKERLVSLKQKLSQAENDRSRRIGEEQSKLDELKLRLTPNHPQVITQEERLGMASQVSSELSMMRGEVSDLESQVRQREAMSKTSRPAGSSGVGSAAEALPTEILGLLDEREVDPALSAQMSGAIVRYGSLRDDVRGAQLALDTAQAAFNHRYQVVAPVEEPGRPAKPKVPVILGAGFVISLLLAFLLPVFLEVRRDVLVERWQVHHFQLPVLAELRLPPGNKERS